LEEKPMIIEVLRAARYLDDKLKEKLGRPYPDACHLTDVGGLTEAVRKASREETAGDVAPTLVSIYGDLPPVLDRFRTGTTVE
jgi:hypothetical protein